MAARWKLECMTCGKSESFMDSKDIAQAKWTILAWDVKTAEPKCVCEKCEYQCATQDKNAKK